MPSKRKTTKVKKRKAPTGKAILYTYVSSVNAKFAKNEANRLGMKYSAYLDKVLNDVRGATNVSQKASTSVGT